MEDLFQRNAGRDHLEKPFLSRDQSFALLTLTDVANDDLASRCLFPNDWNGHHFYVPDLATQCDEFFLDQWRGFSRPDLTNPLPDNRQRIWMDEIENGTPNKLVEIGGAKELDS